MTEELHSDVIATPPSTTRWRLTAAIGGLVAVAAGVVIVLQSRRSDGTVQESRVVPPPVVPSPTVPEPGVSVPAPIPPSSPIQSVPPPPGDVQIVFSVGGEVFMELDSINIPTYRRARFVDEPGMTAAIADVALKDMPAHLAAWRKRGVIVNGECTARVTSFAVVSRLTGIMRDVDPDDDSDWTPKTVMEHGAQVLAARLDGCPGAFARDATHRPIARFEEDYDNVLADAAHERFIASTAVADTQAGWVAAGEDGLWYEADDARVLTRVLRNPSSGVRWVLVHGIRPGECGIPGGNVLALYRVDAQNKLVEVALRGAGMPAIDHVIDLDADGTPELVSATPTDTSIDRVNGETVTSLGIRELGCGC